MNYTDYGYRINQITAGSGPNWLFLPGGPGLGSEYLTEFCNKLQLPGAIFVLDFPQDGTNTAHGELDLECWKEGLMDLLQSFSNPILVTHSFSGMLALMMPELEQQLSGLVLMNTTTQNTFFPHINAMQEKYDLPDLVPAAGQYHLDPSNETYKAFWHTYKHYCFTAEELSEGEKMLPLFAFNNTAYYYAVEHFYIDYACKWSPKTIPAMTIASEQDFICPPQIFLDDERFQSPNMMNKLISNAGHCPWVICFEQVQQCFDDYVETLPTSLKPNQITPA